MRDQRRPHVLVVPYPIEGHMRPMVKLSQRLAHHHGVKATLVVTEHVRSQLLETLQEEGPTGFRIAAVPDGLDSEEIRRDEKKFAANVFRVFPCFVKNLIEDSKNDNDHNKQFSCLVTDAIFEWAVEIADKTSIKLAMFWTSSPGMLALALSIPRLIEAGIIDNEGTLLKEEKIELFPDMPLMKTSEFGWYNSNTDNKAFQKIIFNHFCATERVARSSKWLLCNWFDDLSHSCQDLIPRVVPVGPLLVDKHYISGTLKPEDSTCLAWLDRQPFKSVIYASFGSISKLTQDELHELALGLEFAGRPFLWVVRSGLTSSAQVEFPCGFLERVYEYGKIVEWAPQEVVLRHPSIGCFLTHCGWNSTMEGISSGVPLLCWPCFAEQMYTRTCICDGWKIGLCLKLDEKMGIISRVEVKSKIEQLVSSDDIRMNSLKLKEMASKSIEKGGSSFESVERFVKEIS